MQWTLLDWLVFWSHESMHLLHIIFFEYGHRPSYIHMHIHMHRYMHWNFHLNFHRNRHQHRYGYHFSIKVQWYHILCTFLPNPPHLLTTSILIIAPITLESRLHEVCFSVFLLVTLEEASGFLEGIVRKAVDISWFCAHNLGTSCSKRVVDEMILIPIYFNR